MTETKHPLLETPLYAIQNWEAWLKLWNETPYLELRHSLLHFGFDVPCEEPNKRILFYLSIADGWNGSLFANEDRLNYSPFRREPRIKKNDLLRKAFEVFCLRFFKPMQEGCNGRYNFSWVCEEQVLPAILNFFYGIDHSHYDREVKRLKNLAYGDSDKHSMLARTYLPIFIEWAWNLTRDRVDDKTIERVNSYRPAFVELLDGLNRIDIFKGHGMKLDEPSLAKLEELALTRKYNFLLEGKSRFPTTIEEAVCAGSPAAQLLLLYRVSEKERKRLQAIADLEDERRDAERKLKMLRGET